MADGREGDELIKILMGSLLLTLAFEETVAYLWGLRGGGLLLCLLVNVMTNPMAVTLHSIFPVWQVTALLEVGVVLAEGACYRFCNQEIRRPWLLALISNGVSFGLGLVFNGFL